MEKSCDGRVVAAFVGETRTSRRQPASRQFVSEQEARRWIEWEARQVGLPVAWDSPSA
jgi:hypothetical protein